MQETKHYNDTYENIKGKVITPNAGPAVENGVDLFLSADFIYWYSSFGKEDATDLVRDFTTADARANGVKRTGNLKALNSLDPGFKVAIGLDLNYDGWDTLLEYTWLRPKDTKSNDVTGTDKTLRRRDEPSYATRGLVTAFNTLKRTIRLSYNTINWELGRSYFVSPKLTLRPHFGLKGAWQTLRRSAHTSGITSTDFLNVSVVTGSSVSHAKQDYWGIGIRAGLNTSWMFSRNWSMFGNMAFSPLWGRFKTTTEFFLDTVDTQTGFFTFDNTKVSDMKEVLRQVNYVMDMQLGIRWDYFFSNNDYRLRLQAGWEEQVWIDFIQFYNATGVHPNHALTFQGLTFKARFDF